MRDKGRHAGLDHSVFDLEAQLTVVHDQKVAGANSNRPRETGIGEEVLRHHAGEHPIVTLITERVELEASLIAGKADDVALDTAVGRRLLLSAGASDDRIQ